MAEHEPDADRYRTPGVEHEPTDVDIWRVMLFGIALMVVGGMIAVVLWVVFAVFAGPLIRQRDGRALSSVTVERLPEPPVLESLLYPSTPIGRQQDEEASLRSYGWIDQKNGVVHIPIDAAIDLLAGQLPFNAPKKPADQAEPLKPTDSNSGRSVPPEL